jgi:hypothetical protein
MSNQEIQYSWERAERYAQAILEAKWLGIDVEGAKVKQKSLRLWLGMVKEYGLVYNGTLDEYANMQL